MPAEVLESAMDPERVADLTIAAVKAGRLYIHTHALSRQGVEDRFNRIIEAYRYAQ
jgi:hypothetical protein